MFLFDGEELRSVCVFRHQLQELRLKQEQNELKTIKRKDLQGETAGEKVRPRRRSARPTFDPRPGSLRGVDQVQRPQVATGGRHTASTPD